MSTLLIDQLAGELDRVRKELAVARKERDKLAAALEELHRQLLNEEDIIDGPDPDSPPKPNWAMQADMLLGTILERMELEPSRFLAAHDAAKDAEIAALRVTVNKMQRLWDLCRHQRAELHVAGLIDDGEFAALAEDYKSVDRLEAYDAARDEIVALAAGLQLAHEQMLMAGMGSDEIERTMGLDACKLALGAHDRALVKPLVEALDTIPVKLMLAIGPPYMPVHFSESALKQIDAILAPYARCLCDGSGTVFDSPSSPCPTCTKEPPHAAPTL